MLTQAIYSLGKEVERDAPTVAMSDSLRLLSPHTLQNKQTNSQHLETEAAHVRGKKIRHTSKDTQLLMDLTCV